MAWHKNNDYSYKIRQDLSFPTLASKKISRPSDGGGGGGAGVCPKKSFWIFGSRFKFWIVLCHIIFWIFGFLFKFWIMLCHKKTFDFFYPVLKALDLRKFLKKDGYMEKSKDEDESWASAYNIGKINSIFVASKKNDFTSVAMIGMQSVMNG